MLIINFLIILTKFHKNNINNNKLKLNSNYLSIQKYINLSFKKKLRNIIKIGLYCHSIKNGGTERIVSILINFLYKIKIFEIYLFTNKKKENNSW